MKRIEVTDGTYRVLKAMVDTDRSTMEELISAMAGRELERRRERYDARDAVRNLNREILRPRKGSSWDLDYQGSSGA